MSAVFSEPTYPTPDPVKNLLIIETVITGHRPTYLRRIMVEAIRQNYHVTLAMPAESFQHPVIQRTIAESSSSHLRTVECPSMNNANPSKISAFNLTLSELNHRRFFKTAFTKAASISVPDVILLPYFDCAANAVALLGAPFSGIPWAGIVMRQSFHFEDMNIIGPPSSILGNIKKRLFLKLLAKTPPSGLILTIDPSLVEFISKKYSTLSPALVYLPDPGEIARSTATEDLRESLGIPQDATVILLYGSILVGKGLSNLTEAFSSLDTNVYLLLAGKQNPTVNQKLDHFLKQSPDLAQRIHQINRYIDDAEEPSIFKTADMVWLGYKGHYAMSGVLIQAARSNLPVIATQEGLIGWLTEKYKLGVVTDTAKTDNIVAAVNTLTRKNSTIEADSFRVFYQHHTIGAFYDSLFGLLDNSCDSVQKSPGDVPT